MAQASYKKVNETCTTVEENKDYAKLPGPIDRGYLFERVEFARTNVRYLSAKVKADGSVVERFLMQVVVSGIIHAEEKFANDYWLYKAEVSFDMTPVKLGEAPKPFLSYGKDNSDKSPSRRHSRNYFPTGAIPGLLRRPDVIIVKNRMIRWPGRAAADHDGVPHPDNLRRVVEIKFPGDALGEEQELAYLLIAGGKDRFSVLDVNDCDGELERAKARAKSQAQTSTSTAPNTLPTPPILLPPPLPPRSPSPEPIGGRPPSPRPPEPTKEPRPILPPFPLRTTAPALAEKRYFEHWVHNVGEGVYSVWEQTAQGLAHLSESMRAWLEKNIPWLLVPGRWAYAASEQAYQWISTSGAVITRWTTKQIQVAWAEISRQTDLAWEQLKGIQWGQIMADLGKGLVLVVLIVSGVVITYVIAATLIPLLLALLGGLAAEIGAAAAALGLLSTATLVTP